MELAILLLLCVGIIAYGIWGGRRTGAVAQMFTLGSILLCYGIAVGVALLRPELRSFKLVPLMLQPFVLGAVLATITFVALTFWTKRKIKDLDEDAIVRAMEAGEPEPEKHTLTESPRNRKWGMVIGGVKGVVLAGALFWVMNFIGNVAMFADAQQQAGAQQGGGAAPEASNPALQVFGKLGRQINSTPVLSSMADGAQPIKHEMLDKLTKISKDEEKMERFSTHPRVQAIGQHPRLRDLSEDQQIAGAIEEQNWFVLMDNPKIRDLARDVISGKVPLLKDFQNLDGVMDEVLAAPPAQPDVAPTPTPGSGTQFGTPPG